MLHYKKKKISDYGNEPENALKRIKIILTCTESSQQLQDRYAFLNNQYEIDIDRIQSDTYLATINNKIFEAQSKAITNYIDKNIRDYSTTLMQSLETQYLNTNEKRRIISEKTQEAKKKLRDEAHSLYDPLFNSINTAVQIAYEYAAEQAETHKLDPVQKNKFIISAINDALTKQTSNALNETIIIKAEDFKKHEDTTIIDIIQKYFSQGIETLNQQFTQEIEKKSIALANELSMGRLDRNELENELKNFTDILLFKHQHEITKAIHQRQSLDLMFVEYTITNYKINGLALNTKAIKTAAQQHTKNFQDAKNRTIEDIINDFKTITSITINTNNILNAKILEAQQRKTKIQSLESTLIIAKSTSKKRKSSSTKKKLLQSHQSFTPDFEEKKSKLILTEDNLSFAQPGMTLSNTSAKLLDNLEQYYEDRQGKLSDIIQDIKESLTNVEDIAQAIDRISKKIMPSTTISPKAQLVDSDKPIETTPAPFDEALTHIFHLIIEESLKEEKQEKAHNQLGL